MKNKISKLKNQQRKKFEILRKEINQKQIYNFNEKLINQLFIKKINNIKIVSSFFSIKTEIPTNELNNYLLNKFKILTFPSVNDDNKILTFREFNNNQSLVVGKYDIPEPPKHNQEYFPDLLFVPCLAFDKNGYRLGYGGGFYDRTFEYFNSLNHKFIAVGFAYDQQMTENLLIENFDHKLNYVLTEKHLYTFK